MINGHGKKYCIYFCFVDKEAGLVRLRRQAVPARRWREQLGVRPSLGARTCSRCDSASRCAFSRPRSDCRTGSSTTHPVEETGVRAARARSVFLLSRCASSHERNSSRWRIAARNRWSFNECSCCCCTHTCTTFTHARCCAA